ncbi:unnamed protein product, partial [Prorocentrum cordatum]
GCAEVDCAGASGALAEGQEPVLSSCYDEMPVELPSAERSEPAARFQAGALEEPPGPPLRSASMFLLQPGSRMRQVRVHLHCSGLALEPVSASSDEPSAPREFRALSPFCVTEQLEDPEISDQLGRPAGAFKLTELRQGGDVVRFFGLWDADDAQDELDRWICEIQRVTAEITSSMFSAVGISPWPLPDVAATFARILAGHLLVSDEGDTIVRYFCELRAHSEGKAALVMYSNCWCAQEIRGLPLVADTFISQSRCEGSTVFSVGSKRFSAQSGPEKDLWLRAIINTKARHRAPGVKKDRGGGP